MLKPLLVACLSVSVASTSLASTLPIVTTPHHGPGMRPHADLRIAQGAAPVPSAQRSLAELIEPLVALPDHSARRTRLVEEVSSTKWQPDQLAAIGQALAVVSELERHGRSDPSIVRLFLRAALSDDATVRAATISAAQQNGDPPSLMGTSAATTQAGNSMSAPASIQSGAMLPTSPEPSAGVSPDKLEMLKRYKAQRLVRDKLNFTMMSGGGKSPVTYTSVATWTVYDGGGAPYSARGFGEKVGDDALLVRMEDEFKGAIMGGVGLGLGGVLLAVLSKNALDNSQDGESLYPILGFTLGLTAAGCSIAPPMYIYRRQQFVANYYSTDDVDTRIRAYNQKLAEGLNLSPSDVSGLDLQSRLKPALKIQPWVSLTSVGVSGQF